MQIAGVDIGGTFTDFVLNTEGVLKIHKRFSTPHDPAQAMLDGLKALTDGDLAGLAHIAHGSTVATNAILERKGARIALLTTQGFGGILAIGRQNRPKLYTLYPKIPALLVRLEHCYEVRERLDYTGAVITPLNLDALDGILNELIAAQIEAVAVCFLYSYRNPAHEQAVRARILERGLFDDSQIALSCEVMPEFREYERASTVTLEAYVRPVISRYLDELTDSLPTSATLRVMKSDGGTASARRVARQAVQTALSGPAAGVIGAFGVAALAGFDQIITLDIGGTSTDVSLCPGQPIRQSEREIDGLPMRTPALDIETIGAGGGSIARLDAGGALRVGPGSAGAQPGAIIYGRGGQQITVSDAHAVLGRLDPDHFLDGSLKLDIPAAQAAIESLAARMKLDVYAAANGIIEIANVKIEQAIRRVSVARGHDPRQFTLVAFGGAGPLHGCEVAERLGIPRVLIPRYPGAMCALGLLMADVVIDYSRSVLGLPLKTLSVHFTEMMDQAQADLAREGITADAMQFIERADVRYQGQAYELSIPFGNDLTSAFHEAHRRRYGYSLPDRPIEVVNVRVQAIGLVDKPTFTAEPLTLVDNGSGAYIGQKLLILNSTPTPTTLYQRDRLKPGAQFGGPALIFQLDSTVYVPPGWSVLVDSYHNLSLTRSGSA